MWPSAKARVTSCNGFASTKIEFCLFPELALKQPISTDDGHNALIRMNVYGIKPDRHVEIERRFNVVAREAYGMTEMGSVMFMPMEAIDMVGSGSVRNPVTLSRVLGLSIPTERHWRRARSESFRCVARARCWAITTNQKRTLLCSMANGFAQATCFRRDERGYYYLVGRLKDMIRRSGENVSALEVERVLKGMAEVLEAAVIGVPDETRGEEILAIVVLAEGASIEPSRLFSCCAESLARFKIPRFLRVEPSLPKTPSGKIAKAGLRERWRSSRAGCFDRLLNAWL